MKYASLLFVLISFVPLLHGFGSNCDGNVASITGSVRPQDLFVKKETEWTPEIPLPYVPLKKNLRVAFIGDQGLGDDAKRVMKMTRRWGSDFIIHAGDFDYKDRPEAFERQLNRVLGEDFPYFATIGNHDLLQWPYYRKYLVDRLKRTGTKRYCRGDYGVNMVCNYGGIVFVLSGIGVKGKKHVRFVDEALGSNDAAWKICVWHKNQDAYQTGQKPDEVGYSIYETCRKHGAIIFTAHEHSYSRTYLMDDFVRPHIVHRRSSLDVRPGQSFVFVSGLGGKSIRPWEGGSEYNPWWAALASASNGVNHGALMCEFKSEEEATCVFEDIDGNNWDSFDMTSPGRVKDMTGVRMHDVPDMLDIQVSNAQHLALLDGDSVACEPDAFALTSSAPSPMFLVQPESFKMTEAKRTIFVQFTPIQLDPSLAIDAVHLQLLGAHADAHMIANMTIRGVMMNEEWMCSQLQPNGLQRTQTEVAWTLSSSPGEPLDDGEVWVSPNLAPIVSEMMQSGSYLDRITFVMEPSIESEVEVYGSRNLCFAPSLTIQQK